MVVSDFGIKSRLFGLLGHISHPGKLPLLLEKLESYFHSKTKMNFFPFKDKNDSLSIQRLKTIFLSSQFDIEFCAFLRVNDAGKPKNK